MPVSQTTTSWVVLSGNDIRTVLTGEVFDKCEGNVGQDIQVGDPFDSTQPKRSDALVQLAVQQVRAAIQAAGRFPLSAVPNAIPQRSVQHALYLAAWQMISSTPNTQMVVLTEKGAYAPMGQFVKAAQDHVEALRGGAGIDVLTDPTGMDYLTAADPVTNPLPCLVNWSDGTATDANYAAGFYTPPFSSSRVALPVDNMTIY